MAVIVSPALSPCHISPTHSPLDLAISPSLADFSTPRSLHGIDIVAAAAALTPLSDAIIDPTSSHEYCLSTKRSRDDCDDSQFGIEHESKRLKLDDTYVPSFDDASVITSDEQFFGVVHVAIDDPLATDLYNASFAPPPPIPVSFVPEEMYFSAECPPPLQSSSSSLFPEQHIVVPAATFNEPAPAPTEIELVDEDAEGDIDDELFPPMARSLQPISRRWLPVHEPPLWQLLCKMRVENVKKSFPSVEEFRAAVNGEVPQVPAVSSSPSPETSQEQEECSQSEVVDLTDPRDDVIPAEQEAIVVDEKTQDPFRVEICTPSDFKDEFKTEVVITPDVDTEMRSAFDDWDSEDSESEDSDEGDYDLEDEDDSLISPHESLVSFNFPDQDSEDEPLEDAMQDQCVQTRMVPRGTPGKTPDWAKGSLWTLRASRASRVMS